MLLSTLRDYIGKMGGELELTARFPDREPVKIKGFADLSGSRKSRSTTHTQQASGRKAKSQHKRVAVAS